MLEIKVTIAAPDLSASIEKLAEALKGSLFLSPGGVEARLSGVQATAAGNPTDTSVAATVENAPSPQTNAQHVSAQNAVDQTQAVQPEQVVQQQAMNPPETAAAAPIIDLETISRAGAALIDQGKMADVLELLKRYGVQAVNQLDPSQFPAFAEDLKALGAAI